MGSPQDSQVSSVLPIDQIEEYVYNSVSGANITYATGVAGFYKLPKGIRDYVRTLMYRGYVLALTKRSADGGFGMILQRTKKVSGVPEAFTKKPHLEK